MPSYQHKTVTVNSVEEGIQQARELAFTLIDLHFNRVLDSDLYEKIDKPQKKGPKASIANVIDILEGLIAYEQMLALEEN